MVVSTAMVVLAVLEWLAVAVAVAGAGGCYCFGKSNGQSRRLQAVAQTEWGMIFFSACRPKVLWLRVIYMAVVAHPHQASMSQMLNLAADLSTVDSNKWPCAIEDQMLAFNAATGNALTTVLAGFAFTSVSLPNMILLVALVAGFLRVLILARPGMVNTPVFFASAAPISPK